MAARWSLHQSSSPTRFGVTLQKLHDGKALVDAVVAAKQAQGTETAEFQHATQARDDTLDVLDSWISDFTAIDKIDLAGTQLSEVLGSLKCS